MGDRGVQRVNTKNSIIYQYIHYESGRVLAMNNKQTWITNENICIINNKIPHPKTAHENRWSYIHRPNIFVTHLEYRSNFLGKRDFSFLLLRKQPNFTCQILHFPASNIKFTFSISLETWHFPSESRMVKETTLGMRYGSWERNSLKLDVSSCRYAFCVTLAAEFESIFTGWFSIVFANVKGWYRTL